MPEGRAQRWDDTDPAIRAFVEHIVDTVRAQWGGSLCGVYLHGSLAMGCYRRAKSDLDILIVVADPLSPTDRERFARAFVALSDDRPTQGDLELSVITAANARHFVHPLPFEVHYSAEWKEAIRRGEVDFAKNNRDPDLAAHLTVTRSRGIALLGPLPSEMFGPVPGTDYLAAILDDFRWIVAEEGIFESPVYGVLNICRMLQLMTEGEGTIASKEEGALWGLAHLPPAHHPVIAQALEVYRSDDPVTEETRRTGGHAWNRAALEALIRLSLSRE